MAVGTSSYLLVCCSARSFAFSFGLISLLCLFHSCVPWWLFLYLCLFSVLGVGRKERVAPMLGAEDYFYMSSPPLVTSAWRTAGFPSISVTEVRSTPTPSPGDILPLSPVSTSSP